jgi:AhpD family alkylhydroperoxidase
MHTNKFEKRFYTLPTFKKDVQEILAHFDDLRQASRSGRIDKAFAEKLMLVVTGVNGCRYCSYGHSRAALVAGVSKDEITKLLKGELDNVLEEEAIALAYAQHYADSFCQPDPAATQRLVDAYGTDKAKDIQAYLRMITFGNLLGNTFDILISRLKGKPTRGSSLYNEVGVLLGALVAFPAGVLMRSLSGIFR